MKEKINMKTLGRDYTCEVVDSEVIFYVGQGDKTDYDTPHILDCYIANAFSLQMLEDVSYSELTISEIDGECFDMIKPHLKSAVGHQDTANVLGVECSRVNVSLRKGDILIVAQLQGGRLPEGSTTLPEGFSFKYLLVEVEE
jgi:hypothetical protein